MRRSTSRSRTSTRSVRRRSATMTTPSAARSRRPRASCSRCGRDGRPMTAAERFKEWAVLELFGHRKFAGLVTEVELGGAQFLRIDVPSDPPVTQFYGGKAVYCLTPVDEDTCRRFAGGVR